MALTQLSSSLIFIDEPKYLNTNTDLSDHYPISTDFSNLKILSYNLQLMPMFLGAKGKGNLAELKQAVAAISSYLINSEVDICCVQELFDNSANELLTKSLLDAGFIASTRLEPSIVPLTNGGIRTFLKRGADSTIMPVTHTYFYRNTIDYLVGADALVYKGIIHTPYLKNGIRYHLFNTHLQSYYPTREHYAEVTLAQCIELKTFVEQQILKGIIKPNEPIILCGDFNLPIANNDEPSSLLFVKMRKILGPRFGFMNYHRTASGPQHTFSARNIYNHHKKGDSDLDINTDAILLFNNELTEQEQIDHELSALYCDIQNAIAYYVRNNATFISSWLLSPEHSIKLHRFNKQFAQLIDDAEKLKVQNKNPITEPTWFAQALFLAQGPGHSEKEIITFIDATLNEGKLDDIVMPEKEINIDHARLLYQRLVIKLQLIHTQIHANYIYLGLSYQKTYVASLNLHRVLDREGKAFFTNPSSHSFTRFKNKITYELKQASNKFEECSYTWSKLHPIFKGLLGIIALLTAVPFLYILATSLQGYRQTFFPKPLPTLAEVEGDLNNVHALFL